MRFSPSLGFLTLLALGAAASAHAQPQPAPRPAALQEFTVTDGKIRFYCEGPDIVVPAWGQFGVVGGKASFNSGALEKTKGAVTIMLSSVNTEDSGWDAAFRAAEFLGIVDFPKSTFSLWKVTPLEKPVAGRWVLVTLHGELELHGVHRKLDVPAAVRWESVSGAEPESFTVRASFNVKWTDYNIAIPGGLTKTFTGDGARVQIELTYGRAPKTK